MQLYPELRIQSAVEALTHVVIPALDPNDKLAQEQARLVVATLELARERLAVQFDYDKRELQLLIAALESVEGSSSAALGDTSEVGGAARALAAARDVHRRAGVSPSELRAAVGTTKAALGALTTAAYQVGGDARRDISGAVMTLAEQMLPLVRASYAAHGFDPAAAAGPTVAELLAAAESEAIA